VDEVFHELAQAQRDAVEWAQKCDVNDGQSLSEAIQIGKSCVQTVKAIQDRRKEILEPLKEYVDEVNALAKGAIQPFTDAESMVNTKIEAYNARKKAEAKAEQDRLNAEIAAKILKDNEEKRRREAEENARQIEEANRLRAENEAKQKELRKIKDENARLAAELKAEQELLARQAEIEKERLERERVEAEKAAAEKEALEKANTQFANDMAKAQFEGKTKGVQEVWNVEVVDEKALPRTVLSFDKKKAMHLLKAGFGEIPGCRCWKSMNAVKR
jgi:type I site-specific restriction-modification system R (restriction) subunit